MVDQDPIAGVAKVKEDRKIYIKLILLGISKRFAFQNLIEKTYRQAIPTLKSLGLERRKITYKPYIGKDMVLKMYLNGKKLKPVTRFLNLQKLTWFLVMEMRVLKKQS